MGRPELAKDIIDKDSFLKKRSLTMIKATKRKKLCSDVEAENGAERYVRIFDAPECRLFFLKVMYHLPYDERERIREAALKGKVKNPKKYFTYCAKRSLEKFGY